MIYGIRISRQYKCIWKQIVGNSEEMSNKEQDIIFFVALVVRDNCSFHAYVYECVCSSEPVSLFFVCPLLNPDNLFFLYLDDDDFDDYSVLFLQVDASKQKNRWFFIVIVVFWL